MLPLRDESAGGSTRSCGLATESSACTSGPAPVGGRGMSSLVESTPTNAKASVPSSASKHFVSRPMYDLWAWFKKELQRLRIILILAVRRQSGRAASRASIHRVRGKLGSPQFRRPTAWVACEFVIGGPYGRPRQAFPHLRVAKSLLGKPIFQRVK